MIGATETDPRGIETSYAYTTDGLLASVTYAVGTPDQATVSYGYVNDELRRKALSWENLRF